ncbi:peptidase inhibitor family I36 protein [Streptomyces sp. NPDC050418]|uniref:peptidase inhibitor family I36 protein n=1 Tax=Streptomyces sp. NPDC050418 TaxID=3365612 RepID=UPI00379A497A
MAKHLRTWAAAAATAAAAAIVAVPGTAQAGNSYRGCDSGAVCAYTGLDMSGSIVREKQGDWGGSTGYKARSLFNNGNNEGEVDHIRYSGTVDLGDGWYQSVKGCLHYSTGAAPDADSYANFPGPTTISKAVWGKECESGEGTRVLGPRFRA